MTTPAKPERLTIAGIRGYRDTYSFELGPEITVIYGPNGTGKSSFAEAWEWLYTGQHVGDMLEPRNETKEGFGNLHAANPPAVDLVFSSAQAIVRKGKDLPSVSPGLPFNPNCSPVVLQYRLQKAVYSSDKDRTEFFATVMGLDGALELRTEMRKAANSADSAGTAGQALWATVYDAALRIGTALPVKQPLLRQHVTTNDAALLALLSPFVGGAKTLDDCRKALLGSKGAATTNPSLGPVLSNALAAETAFPILEAGVAGLETIKDIDIDALERAKWLRRGLEFSSAPDCALCDTGSLTPERVAAVSKEADGFDAQAKTYAQAKSMVNAATSVASGWQASHAATARAATAAVLAALKEVEASEILTGAVSAFGAAVDAWAVADATIDPANQAGRLAAALALNNALRSLAGHTKDVEDALAKRLRPLNENRLRMAALEYLESDRATWAIGLETRAILEQATKLCDAEFAGMLQDAGIAVKKSILEWYNLLRPQDSTPLTDVEINTSGTIKVRLKATAHGQDGHASALCSHSNINALGMACHIARILHAGHGTIVLDDPTQALDDPNKHHFEKKVVETLLQRGIQVVILTHDRASAGNLLDVYWDRDVQAYEFGTHERAGPTCKPMVADADHLIRNALEIIELKNEARADDCALAVRQLTEKALVDYLVGENAKVPKEGTLLKLIEAVDRLPAGIGPRPEAMHKVKELQQRVQKGLHAGKPGPGTKQLKHDLVAIIDLRRSQGHLKAKNAGPWPSNAGLLQRVEALRTP